MGTSERDVPIDEAAARTAQREFEQHVAARRRQAGIVGDPGGAWGLALSGGGVRSATFCLGLLRGLAKNGLLREFDYLSTVSGGGYVGASLGRLFGPAKTADEVERGVADDDSMWLWWLRRNGRYLTPTGAKDLGYATASILRGIVATHLEIGVLILLLAALVLLPHLLVSLWLPPRVDGSLLSLGILRLAPSVWWWLLPLPAFAIVHQACAYWYVRDKPSVGSVLLISAAGLGSAWLAWRVSVAAGARLSPSPPATGGDPATIVLLVVLSFLALAPTTAWLASAVDLVRRRPIAVMRLERTKRLAYALWALAACCALGLLDWGTWRLTALFWDPRLERPSYGLTVLVAAALAIGRVALPPIQRRLAAAKQPFLNVDKALNLLGIALALLVALFWTTLLSVVLYRVWPAPDLVPPTGLRFWETPQSGAWLAVVALCAFYALATHRSFDLLNLASLHNFYRARIERAYVSSGNGAGGAARFPRSALEPVSLSDTRHVAPLTEAIEGDDVDLADYAPQRHGGPIHLINCCINQSVDDNTGVYNADRKGVALTVGPLGPEVGTALPTTARYAAAPGTLSRWIAISGAAASTGMGSRTSPGFAALLFMSGLRLGYWTRSLIASDAAVSRRPKPVRTWLLRWLPKPLAIVAESIARFPGLYSPLWYVSDGGHFDNTGIYALLKRRARVIVAADCGADPKYLFADLESLVRKAKIDYGATIEFVDAQKAGATLPDVLDAAVGTPETIGPDAGARWLVLGRIGYADGSEGTLLVVKPRRLDRMPFDIVAYADRNPDFPQQTTGDQFFDEAQWEAYHQLGLLLGGKVTHLLTTAAVATVAEMTHTPSSLSRAERQAKAQAPKVRRRDRAALTVRASLGAGLSLSVLLALWQGVEQFRESRRSEAKDYDTLYESLDGKIATAKISTLLSDQFETFAKQSKARGDGRFALLQQHLNERCEGTPDPKAKSSCQALYRQLMTVPKPFYDYWMTDKLLLAQAAVQARTIAGDASAAVAAAMPEKTPPATPAANASQPPRSPPDTLPPLPPDGATPSPDASPDLQAAPPEPTRAPASMPRDADAAPASAQPAQAPAATDAAARAACRASNARAMLHIYDEISRPAALRIAARLQRLGFRAPPIENVVATAERQGRDAPYVWSTPALIVHPGNAAACVRAVAPLVARDVSVRPLPASLRGNPGMFEIWLPPRTETVD